MSSAFYPLGMNSYNNRTNQGGYKSSKGTGIFSNQTGVTSGNIRPLTNNDPMNSAPQKFGLSRPIKHYRKGITFTTIDDSTNSRQVKSSSQCNLIGQMIDIPGGYTIKPNTSTEILNIEQLDRDCKTCQGIGLVDDWQPITNLTEKPQPETQTLKYCCNEERNALKRIRSANTKLKKNYYTTTINYLYNRCQTFDQKQFNYLSSGNAATKPGAPFSQNNIYKANCNPNLEIQYATSLLSDAPHVTPSNSLGCETVQYKPNNYKYAQQGAVSSSDRLLRLNVETIDTNRANIIKSQENLFKSKYFPNASGTENKPCCMIGSKAVASFGTTILYITYNSNYSPLQPVINPNSRLLKVKSTTIPQLPPTPIIQNEYIIIVPSYEIIDEVNKKIKLSLKYQLFTNDDAILLNVGLSFADNVDYYNERIKTVEILQFDGMPLFGGGQQFAGLIPEIIISAPDQPRIINGTSTLNGFNSCINFNSPGIINWNIKNVINMHGMFQNTPLFNQNISTWDTSAVTDMHKMFQNATAFNNGQTTNIRRTRDALTLNENMSDWNTSAVTDMSSMFESATSFNQDISSWDTGNVIDMSSMFESASAFNNGLAPGVTGSPLTWDTSKVSLMNNMFQLAIAFNQSIGTWNTARVTDMAYMFQTARLFNNGETGTADISGNVATAYYTNSGSVLTCPDTTIIPQLAVGNVIIITTGPITSPTIVYTSKIATIPTSTTLTLTLNYGANIGTVGVPIITSIKKQVIGTADLSWNTAILPDMQYMFSDATYFNQRVNTFTVGNATHMFSSTSSATPNPLRGIFNNGQLAGSNDNSLRYWNTAASGSTGAMFLNSSGFNQNVSNWNVSNVGYMGQMFQFTQVYNNGLAPGLFDNDSSLNSWVTTSLTDFQVMFNNAIAFNQNVSNWDVSKVTTMNGTFRGATLFNNGDISGNFNQPLTSWYAPKCVDFTRMFSSAPAFNQNISNLVDTSTLSDPSGCNLTQMFSAASTFNNGDIAGSSTKPLNWITDNVTNMSSLFVNALVFNQPIDTSGNYWNTGKVTSMFQMVATTNRFNQPIGGWNTGSVTTMGQMFYGAIAFNQPIGGWNTGSVTTMFDMFRRNVTSVFNQNISNWNVSNVTSMSQMFSGATVFNNGSASGLSDASLNWYATKCVNFTSMFGTAPAFNQPIPFLVDTSGNTDPSGCSLASMFSGATVFNQNINTWNMSRVTIMTNTFFQASAFNNGSLTNNGANDLLSWNAPNCTNFTGMFQSATSFNQKVNNLVNTASVIDCSLNSMFQSAIIFNNGQLGTIDISGNFSSATYTNGTATLSCPGAAFTSLSSSDVLIITSGTTIIYTSQIKSIISDASLVLLTPYGTTLAPITTIKKQVIGTADLSWNTTNVKNMSSLFSATYYFNQKLPWNVSNATNMSSMFATGTTALRNTFNNGDLAGSSGVPLNWTATKCTTFVSMFAYTSGFNQPILFLVDTSGVELTIRCNLTSMFQNTTMFNQNISNWNVSRVINMTNMFNTAVAFNNGSATNDGANALTWYAPNCLFFPAMFSSATSFNQPISTLVDTSGVAVCAFNSMFSGATLFNQNISGWNVSKANPMNSMFASAVSFNNGATGNIGGNQLNWNAPICMSFASMFNLAAAFNQQIPYLVDTSGVALNAMFSGATVFNNGQTGTVNITGTASLASYTNGTATLYCPNAAFNSDLSLNDVLIITSGTTIIYTSQIKSIISDASLVLLTPYGTTLAPITTIKKQVAGTADLSWNTTNVTTMANMFNNTYYFNQKISNWSTTNVTSMTSAFAGASTALKTVFNNGQLAGSSGQPLLWTASKCTTFTSMFANTAGFNQPIQTLVDTSALSTPNCVLNSMFQTSSVFNQNISNWNTTNVTNMTSMFLSATTFNNGETGTQTIRGTPSLASYTNTGTILTCADASFNLDLSSNDVIIITTPTLVYSSKINIITNNTTLTLVTPYGSNITLGTITSMKKQVAGNSPLSWNTANVTTIATMFNNATYFNQQLPWNMTKVIAAASVLNAFTGTATTFITLFNNGQIITGITQPLYTTSPAIVWNFGANFAPATWHANCRLTSSNGVTLPAIY
jgi:surface protein